MAYRLVTSSMKSRDSRMTSQSLMSSHSETRNWINPRGTFEHTLSSQWTLSWWSI